MSCELFSANSCVLETNCKDFQNVDIVFVAENPGQDEVEKEVPLIGRAGQTFRKYFKKYHLDNINYLLTNVVLCQTLTKDGKTGNPSKEVIKRCKVNCFDIIEKCNPKLIVLMGSSAGVAFGVFDGSGITSIRGSLFKWKGIDILLTLHPSYINRNREEEPKFENDIRKAAEMMGVKFSENKAVDNDSGKKGIFYYKIPDKYYTSDYRLIDVQYLNKSNEVVYIFRDKDNNKIYHKENDTYVCYQTLRGSSSPLILEYDKLTQVKLPYRQKTTLDSKITYEGDIKITVKHCQDYYLKKTVDDTHIKLNPLFLDIETYSKTREYSTAEEAKNEIAMIGFWYDGSHKTYVVDPKFLNIETPVEKIDLAKNEEVLVFKNEKEMINACLLSIRKIDPDIITGWFADEFDLPYIVNRCKNLGINVSIISKFSEVEIDYHRHSVNIAGIVVTDLLYLYKMFTAAQGQKESYKLDFIANLELKVGKYGDSFNFSEMFRNNPSEAIKYNMQDVRLLPMLNDKMKHIDLQNKLRETCKTNFAGAKGAMGQLDSLIVSYLKEKGFSSKNAFIEGKDSKFEGAYVKPPVTGVHDYIVDFDFTSLYPSLILTYNIGVNTYVMKFDDYTLGYDLAYNKDNLPNEMKVIIDPLNTKKECMVTKEQLLKRIKDDNLICTINGCFFKNHEKELSFYSQILEMRLASRKEYKKKMFDAKVAGNKNEEQLYKIRQETEKIISNSLYGVLGNNAFRFYNIDCARSITLSGQEALKTNIVESNAYVDYLKTGKLIRPEIINKHDMYSEEFNPETKYIITGDTDSVFVVVDSLLNKDKPEDEIVKDVLKYCIEIQTYLNTEIVRSIVSRHSNFPKYNRLELKNELVIKRGLFLAKKRYVNYIIFNENQKVDEIKGMGIETKRSDFPSMSKIKLQELIDLILKSKVVRFPILLKFVKGVESDFIKIIKERKKEISRPVSFGKKLTDYKVQPQGVRGMIAWNTLEFNTFTVGSRGYLFKISGIDLEKAPKEVVDKYNKEFLSSGKKLDVITLPDDIEELPDYYFINEKDMLKFAWIDRYNLMLEPLIPKTSLLKF
jgi:uracil-DNA glycosylase family 4